MRTNAGLCLVAAPMDFAHDAAAPGQMMQGDAMTGDAMNGDMMGGDMVGMMPMMQQMGPMMQACAEMMQAVKDHHPAPETPPQGG